MEAISLEPSEAALQTGRDSNTSDRLLLPHFPLQLDHPTSSGRVLAEQFIARRFARNYNASISHFLPYLLSAHDDFSVCAALGFQPAKQDKPLFLEYYLDCDIETILSLYTHSQVYRHKIVEIGNLASGRQRATQTLFILLADILYQAGYEWVVFTANRSVKNWLEKLDIQTIAIREADPGRLPDKGANWGSYYDDRPVVMASNIHESFSQMKQNRIVNFLRQSYEKRISDFVTELRI